jgi:hypothetical protein
MEVYKRMDDYINKKFKFIVKMDSKAYRGEDGRLYIDGMASNTNIDYEDDRMDTTAIASMNEQAVKGLTGFDGHQYDLNSVFGKIVAVKDKGPDIFQPVFRVLKSMESKVLELLDDGIQLGLSIGGMIKDFDWEDTIRVIKDVLLFEVSLTPIPALGDTLGTVGLSDYTGNEGKTAGCPGNICKQIFKSVDSKYFKGYSPIKDKVKDMDKKGKLEDNIMAIEQKDLDAITTAVGTVIADSNKELVKDMVTELNKADTENADELTVKCPECGQMNTPSDKFCSKCGAKLGKTAEPIIDAKAIADEVMGRVIKEIKGEPEEEEKDDPQQKAYKDTVNTIASDVLNAIAKGRPHSRKDGPEGKFEEVVANKKTISVREAAEKLAKQANSFKMAT